MHASAAPAGGAALRNAPVLFITSERACATPRPSHNVNVTLLPAAPPLGWNTIRVRPTVLRRRVRS